MMMNIDEDVKKGEVIMTDGMGNTRDDVTRRESIKIVDTIVGSTIIRRKRDTERKIEKGVKVDERGVGVTAEIMIGVAIRKDIEVEVVKFKL